MYIHSCRHINILEALVDKVTTFPECTLNDYNDVHVHFHLFYC